MIDNANNQVFITSMSKAVDKARATGGFDVTAARLYKIYTDYIVWLRERNLAGDKEHIQFIQAKLVDLKAKFNNELCNYKTRIPMCGHVPNIYPSNTTNPDGSGTAPSVSGMTINLNLNPSYRFSKEDFLTNYSHPDNTPAYKVIIYISSSSGTFRFDNNLISGTFEFSIEQANKLVYFRNDDSEFATSFNFRVSGGSKYSNLAVNNIIGSELAENSTLTTIGDNTITVKPGVTTVLTINMFTTDTIGPYTDAEGDPLHSIRIDRLHATNSGIFYLSGVEIQDGTIITREQILAGDFTHVGMDQETILSDGFEFSARDIGSMIWVN